MSARSDRVRGASYEIVSTARKLRREQTPAERVLWGALRGRKLDGFKFRRQYPVGSYVLDFVCAECKLVVELDGGHHALVDYRTYDQDRTEHLEQFGFRVIRFSNEEISQDLISVLDQIRNALIQVCHRP